MALRHGAGVKVYDSVPLKQWRGEETRIIRCLDDGNIFPHSEFGPSTVVTVNRLDEGYDPEKPYTLYVRENSAMYFGAMMILTEDKPTLKGRTFELTKVTGKANKETRYIWKELFPKK